MKRCLRNIPLRTSQALPEALFTPQTRSSILTPSTAASAFRLRTDEPSRPASMAATTTRFTPAARASPDCVSPGARARP